MTGLFLRWLLRGSGMALFALAFIVAVDDGHLALRAAVSVLLILSSIFVMAVADFVGRN